MKELRRKVLDITIELALQLSAENGQDYTEVIANALEEACLRLSVDKRQFIKLFVG